MPDTAPTLTLNDGRTMPQLGFGTYQIEDADASEAVSMAVEAGYRLVDTAAIYRNEKGVGAALAGHDEIWLTTKIWNDQQGYRESLAAFDKCLGRLSRDSVDLLLIHWPCADKGKFVDTWKAFIELRDSGKAKSIGVSNFMPDNLEKIVRETGVTPALNQIELHPSFQQKELRQLHNQMGVLTQSWSPLGQGDSLKQDTITRIAEETGRSPAAVIIRWHMQHGLAVIPKASSRNHIEDNFTATQFTLSEQQMAAVDAMDSPEGRIGPDPARFC